MILHSLSLTNFRNYQSASFTFSPSTTLVVGPNASGKTNLLEAVYFLATGRSFRAGYDRETIRRSESPCHLEGVIGRRDGVPHLRGGSNKLELMILANENGKNTSSKRFKVNGVKRRLSDFVGILRAVYFGPEEIQLVTGSPSRRRKYMDSVLVQVDREYARALLEYEKVLRQRNRLLLIIREKGVNPAPHGVQGKGVNEQMEFWNERLLALGAVLSGKREAMFNYFNERLGGRLGLVFLKSMRPLVKEKQVSIVGREVAAGMTLWGPHRDDFGFLKNGSEQLRKLSQSENSENSVNQRISESEGQKVRNSDALTHRGTEAPSYSEFSDLSSFGSRGEQRLAVLHLKLAELEFISEKVGERPPFAKASGGRPVLLLDDIFSELDENNRESVLELLGKQQTIVTSTEVDVLNSKLKTQISKPHLKTINLEKLNV